MTKQGTYNVAPSAGKKRKDLAAAGPPRLRQKTADADTTATIVAPPGMPSSTTRKMTGSKAGTKRKADEELEELAPPRRRKLNSGAAEPVSAPITTPSPPMEKSLADHIDGKLPQELKDMIHDFVFCAGPTTQVLRTGYQPPSPLAVNKAYRAKFAASHYSNCTFKTNGGSDLRKWLLALPTEHRDMIQEIHVNITEATEEQKAEHAARQQRKGLTPKERKAAKNKRKRERNPKNDKNKGVTGRAEARKYWTRANLQKKGIRLRNGVCRFNVKFEEMEEEVWTGDPKGWFWEYKMRKLQDAQNRAREEEGDEDAEKDEEGDEGAEGAEDAEDAGGDEGTDVTAP